MVSGRTRMDKPGFLAPEFALEVVKIALDNNCSISVRSRQKDGVRTANSGEQKTFPFRATSLTLPWLYLSAFLK